MNRRKTDINEPILRTFLALPLTTVEPCETCPSPAMQTWSPLRTQTIVVPCIDTAEERARTIPWPIGLLLTPPWKFTMPLLPKLIEEEEHVANDLPSCLNMPTDPRGI